jgi:hypothetical protein
VVDGNVTTVAVPVGPPAAAATLPVQSHVIELDVVAVRVTVPFWLLPVNPLRVTEEPMTNWVEVTAAPNVAVHVLFPAPFLTTLPVAPVDTVPAETPLYVFMAMATLVFRLVMLGTAVPPFDNVTEILPALLLLSVTARRSVTDVTFCVA